MAASINRKAFRSLSYGLYLISSWKDNMPVGCVVNTFNQVTSSPAQVSVAINKENLTCSGVLETGAFEAVVLAKDAPMNLIGDFGFWSSTDKNKFLGRAVATSEQGIPYINEYICAHISAKVVNHIDVGSHLLFVGEVTESHLVTNAEPMTYAYYHEAKGGVTPPKASGINPED